ADKTYGDPAFTVSATGGGSGNPVTFASTTTSVCTTSGINGSTVTIIAAGSCSITASQAGNDSYNPAPDVIRSFTVNPAPLSLTPDGGKSKTYGDLFAAFTGQVVGLRNSDAVTVTYASLGAPAAADAGSYDITVNSYSFTVGKASNYTITSNTAIAGLKVNP